MARLVVLYYHSELRNPNWPSWIRLIRTDDLKAVGTELWGKARDSRPLLARINGLLETGRLRQVLIDELQVF
jgi:hypothetical protein